ncbi:MAG: DNA mismatch repair protein MutS [Clostridia bacterium]|jgi:DNA mismatch repair protein MutS|nr:DNA mismatch repair protein MutS [Clostridia bacterium]MDH7572914.1 DNA mismatch repair protein MutS [Clostridia bacterium]
MQELTPMLDQYRRIKEQYRDALVFFRLGDFYEMFYEDAEIASRELEITLTSRPAGRAGAVPMCGVPYHAAEGYIARLAARGYRVAICEQTPGTEGRSKLMDREVVRVVTPGTVLTDGVLLPKENHYLAVLVGTQEHWGAAYADVSTGEFYFGSFARRPQALEEELTRLCPAEVVVARPEDRDAVSEIAARLGLNLSFFAAAARAPEEILARHFGRTPEELAAGAGPGALQAAGILVAYLLETQKNSLEHLRPPQRYKSPTHMVLDAATKRNLELTVGRHTGTREGSLVAVLDFTLTPMGGRLLRRWIENPLIEIDGIRARLDSVEELLDRPLVAHELRSLLGGVRDLERLVAKAVYGTAGPRDLLALKDSLMVLPRIGEVVGRLEKGLAACLGRDFDPVTDLAARLEEAIDPQAPPGLEQGGIIRTGYHPEVDRLRRARERGQEWIAGLETRERERTGIKSLKVGYNRVFGYYLEVTKPNLSLVPSDYRRKQTLVNAERFVTPELAQYEELILEAEEKLVALEQRLFAELRREVAAAAARIQQAAARVATWDCLQALAEAAARHNYVRPEVNEGPDLVIRQGRHPVVECHLPPGEFVANDTCLDGKEQRLVILTGPNMAGKSTYMRQVALIVLLAQMGSFVPAAYARIGVVDRIFTRVGAADDLVFGRSTFLMEMLECRTIVEEATARSLVVMDEVGRGTSTYDGLSLAQALLEYIHREIGCRTLFSTHYHELTALEDSLPGVVNYTVAVEEKEGRLVFLRTVGRGRADRSYGIQVAALAGLPEPLLRRAQKVMEGLTRGGEVGQAVPAPGERQSACSSPQVPEDGGQLRLFAEVGPVADGRERAVVAELRRLDLVSMTPLEALNKLYALQTRLKRVR